MRTDSHTFTYVEHKKQAAANIKTHIHTSTYLLACARQRKVLQIFADFIGILLLLLRFPFIFPPAMLLFNAFEHTAPVCMQQLRQFYARCYLLP